MAQEKKQYDKLWLSLATSPIGKLLAKSYHSYMFNTYIQKKYQVNIPIPHEYFTIENFLDYLYDSLSVKEVPETDKLGEAYVYVIKEKRLELFESIGHNFHEENHEGFLELISGKEISGKIKFNCGASTLAHTFGELKRANFIGTNSYSTIDKWLAKYFYFLDGNKFKPYKANVQTDVMRKKANCKAPIIKILQGKIVKYST